MPPKRPKSPGKSSSKPPVKSPGKSPSRSRSGKGGRKNSGSFGWRLHLALAISTLLVIGLVWLARRDVKPPPPVAPPSAPAVVVADPLPAALEQVEAFLAGLSVPADAITREPAEAPREYRIHHRAPQAASVETLRRKLHKLTPPLTLATPEDGVLVIVGTAGKILLSIQFLPTLPAPVGKPPVPGQGGKVAIIMDDLGRSLRQARKLLALDQPVTLAILPGEPHATAVANAAYAAGREVMLHMPMEPQGYPVIDPGDDALLLSQSDDALHESMLAQLAKVPHAVGVNNHMGSRFTEDERAMGVVLQLLQDRNLFFIDSMTSNQSVGSRVGTQVGMQVVRRDVFLDNVAEVDKIVREIERLVEKARRNGSALGICHPYPETFAALQQELPRLAREGVEFVRVAELVGER